MCRRPAYRGQNAPLRAIDGLWYSSLAPPTITAQNRLNEHQSGEDLTKLEESLLCYLEHLGMKPRSQANPQMPSLNEKVDIPSEDSPRSIAKARWSVARLSLRAPLRPSSRSRACPRRMPPRQCPRCRSPSESCISTQRRCTCPGRLPATRQSFVPWDYTTSVRMTISAPPSSSVTVRVITYVPAEE